MSEPADKMPRSMVTLVEPFDPSAVGRCAVVVPLDIEFLLLIDSANEANCG
jgi:hypothetical protein